MVFINDPLQPRTSLPACGLNNTSHRGSGNSTAREQNILELLTIVEELWQDERTLQDSDYQVLMCVNGYCSRWARGTHCAWMGDLWLVGEVKMTIEVPYKHSPLTMLQTLNNPRLYLFIYMTKSGDRNSVYVQQL